MKTMGIIGGMSWESTLQYYQTMNQYIHARLGGHHSIEAILYSLDFERILERVHRNEWGAVGEIMGSLAQKLEAAGADFLIMAVNAIHKVFSEVERAVHIPILHIVDPIGEAVREKGIRKIGLLGTQVTMDEPFFADRLRDRYGIESLVPEKRNRKLLHQIIFDELTVGQIREESRQKLIVVIEELSKRGAEGIILGCTELMLILSRKDTEVPLFDTTGLHAKAAVDFALSS